MKSRKRPPSRMDFAAFGSALDELGWSGAELSRRIGTSEKTVSAWRTGRISVPGAVVSYLELAMKVRRLGKEVSK